MQKMDRNAGAIGFALYLDLLEQLPAPKKGYDVDVLLVYEEGTDLGAVSQAVEQLISEGKGRIKKNAEQNAAKAALNILNSK